MGTRSTHNLKKKQNGTIVREDSDYIPCCRGGYWAPVCCCCWYGAREATGSSKGLLTLMLSLVAWGALPDELIYNNFMIQEFTKLFCDVNNT